MRRLLLPLLLITTPVMALASDLPANGPAGAQAGREGRGGDRAARFAQRIGLSQDQVTALRPTFESFKGRQQALREQTRAAHDVLRRAASGDPSVQNQVDQAAQQVIDAKVAQLQLRKELYAAVAPKLTPEQKAKFLLAGERQGQHGRRWRQGRP